MGSQLFVAFTVLLQLNLLVIWLALFISYHSYLGLDFRATTWTAVYSVHISQAQDCYWHYTPVIATGTYLTMLTVVEAILLLRRPTTGRASVGETHHRFSYSRGHGVNITTTPLPHLAYATRHSTASVRGFSRTQSVRSSFNSFTYSQDQTWHNLWQTLSIVTTS